MSSRAVAKARCSCGKTAYRKWRVAERAMHKTKGAERVYFCTVAGGWHITGYTRSELDQLWASRLTDEDAGVERLAVYNASRMQHVVESVTKETK